MKHLLKDVQDHKGLGLKEIHKLVSSLYADKEAITNLTPEKWVLKLFRDAKRKSKEGEQTNLGEGDTAKTKKLQKKVAVAEEKGEQVNNNHNNKPHDLFADEPMDDEEEDGGYESEPDEWWKR
ncbi:hypothetical protein PG997_013557 [Apiospora hydei]|uniref:Uncharacterized protein n=1 Tax=Apiospora hydei TaxID=1337664 RepID=A0ABR1V6K7_9PEZI